MKIEKIYIGGWFQRTTLHLSEIYDFLCNGTSQLRLNQEKLSKLHHDLAIKDIRYDIDGFEYVTLTTTNGISFKLFEDGLIVLSSDDHLVLDSLKANIDMLTNYYEQKLSPALSYLFSLGAPIPKELANIKTVYPYFIVFNDAPKKKIVTLLESLGEMERFEFSSNEFDLYRGDIYYIINNKKKTDIAIERYIQEQVFLREFKGQLHHYLNLHRIIWERIEAVKESGEIAGKNIDEFHAKIESYSKTINLVEARINQMDSYLHTRERIAKNDKDIKSFLNVIEYRYETLGDSLKYIQQIWNMTKNYVNSASEIFASLQSEMTQKSVENLTVVTSMGVGASLIGLITVTEAPEFTIFGIIYFVALALVGYSSNKIMDKFAKSRKYEISEVEYNKDIK